MSSSQFPVLGWWSSTLGFDADSSFWFLVTSFWLQTPGSTSAIMVSGFPFPVDVGQSLQPLVGNVGDD